MSQLTIANIDDRTLERLRQQAAAHDQPVEVEANAILAEALETSRADPWATANAKRDELAHSGREFPDSTPLIREDRDPKQQFLRLAGEWKAGRGHSSKLADLTMHPAYQQIIGMGERAVPLLLEEMEARPDHWDWALRAITGVDPVPKDAWGKLNEITAAWIGWGKERGYAN
jgi:plasmid stability protein